MNDSYLSDEDYSSVQSVEDIKRILSEAQTPGPNKYNFDNQVRAPCCFAHLQLFFPVGTQTLQAALSIALQPAAVLRYAGTVRRSATWMGCRVWGC